MSRTSASTKWRDRAVAAEADRDEWERKYNTLLGRLVEGLAGALEDGGYIGSGEESEL
ncbi:hypothetical protein [Curtobacterium sp. MCBD17_013]|uniref:hypothetical protein n=1 Tax=Curtobacterium sp. MCBD17_013 TaxID=2175668 RepID=UPI0015E8E55E|nr:hypothetical protein [Curtobacterium sp. MCBD17_013]